MRRVIETLCRLMLRIFFRRVDRVGVERVPLTGPLLIVANHPNGLMDPLVALGTSPRPVSFMAKEPLFRMPVVSAFVKGLDCLPIYRHKDGANPADNRRTMEAARDLLSRGGAVAIFPEGVSHDQPQLQRLKTGAARMALSTQRLLADVPASEPVRIQPVGLYFEDKQTFRSEAVVVWGLPIEVPVVELDAAAEPSREAALALTETIAGRLRALTPEAPDPARVAMAARVARMLAAIELAEGEHSRPPGLDDRLAIMQRLLTRYGDAEQVAPDRLQAVLHRIEAHERDLSYWRLPADHDARLSLRGPVRSLVGTLAAMIVLSPLSLVGLLVQYPAYRFIGFVAHRRYAHENDVVATAKTLGGLVLFPLSWCAASVVTAMLASPWAALAVLLAAPLCAWSSLHLVDHLDALASARRSLWLLLRGADRCDALLAERRSIRDELIALDASIPQPRAASTD